MTLEEIADLIHPGTKKTPAGKGRLNIQCIAHEDRTPSLTIWHDVRGKLAYDCKAGCTNQAVTDRLPQPALDYARSTWGMEPDKIIVFPNKPTHTPTPPQPVDTDDYGLEAEYPYVTEHGELAYLVRRYKGKKIRQYHRGPGDVIKPGRGPADLIPYRLPDVLAANRAGDTIYIVEGEKDADTLAQHGLTATCNVGGAGKWTDNISAWFAGAHIVILPDNDQPGTEHALDVSLKLDGIAETIKIVNLPDLPDKGDVTDWLEGRSVEELLEAVQKHNDKPQDEWTPLDLGPILDGDTDDLDPPPSVLERTDGEYLLYGGEINWMSGEPESGKSWIAQVAAAQELIKGHQVTYIDFEDTPGRIVKRFIGLGVPEKAIRNLLHYVRPSIASTDQQIANLCSAARSSSLGVIDGVTDLHIIHGKDPEANKDVAEIVQRILRPLADAGPAVLPIDHVTKNKETRGRYAIGGQHKLAAVRGASYGVEVNDPFGKGVKGTARIFIAKDRPGHIRGRKTIPYFSKHLAGVFVLEGFSDGREDFYILPPDQIEHEREATVFEAVLSVINNTPPATGKKGISTTTIRDNVREYGAKIANDRMPEILEQMEDQGLVRNVGTDTAPQWAADGSRIIYPSDNRPEPNP